MDAFIKKSARIFFAGLLSCLSLLYFISCQKAVPAPYSDPASGTSNTIVYPAFSANVNNSPTATSFTPIKITEGSYVTLKGVSPYYTLTISLPVTDGPGNYYFSSSAGLRATVNNGTTNYVSDANVNGGGVLMISSINQGKYTATFSFTGLDSIHPFNQGLNVYNGSISNM